MVHLKLGPFQKTVKTITRFSPSVETDPGLYFYRIDDLIERSAPTRRTLEFGPLKKPLVLILMFSDFTWRRIGREKFPLSLNIIAQTLELELDSVEI